MTETSVAMRETIGCPDAARPRVPDRGGWHRVMNLAHFITQAARRHADAIGLVWGERTWTWTDIDQRVDAMAHALAAQGIAKGDRVLVQSRNCNQLFESMFVCFKLGAVWVPANFRQTPGEVAYLAAAAGIRALICQAEFSDHAAAIRAAAPDLGVIIAIGPADFGADYDALVGAHRGLPFMAVAVDRDDPCWFFFTSGTTGKPKAAILTHGQMAFVAVNHLCDLMPGTTTADASLVVAPLSHGAGIHQLAQVARAVKTVLPASDRMDPAEIWSLVARWRITNMFTVPTIVKLLTEHKAVDQHDRSSLRYVIYAGAPMYREDQKYALKTLGPVLVQYFGLGEVTGNITVLPPSLHTLEDGPDARNGTCGYERTGMQIAIQDDAGVECAAGETGEICVCGPAVFAGYYNDPAATAKAFRDGWFRTGDLGYMDRQGFLFITGRSSDMFISGGSNVYPREIEEIILTHPAIAEAAVVGVEHPLWGEVGIAVVVLKANASLDEIGLLNWMSGKIASYKMPKQIVFWDSLPKSGYGKITKNVIRTALFARGCVSAKRATF